MFLYVQYIFSYNIRKLGIASEPGFLFGKVDDHVHLLHTHELAHSFMYKRVNNDDTFYIEVSNMPNVYLTVEDDQTITLRYLKELSNANEFQIELIPNISRMQIMHNTGCVKYDSLRMKFFVGNCVPYDGNQTFISYDSKTGAIIDDYLPSVETVSKKKLIFENS